VKLKEKNSKDKFASALDAIRNLYQRDFDDTLSAGQFAAMAAHHEIRATPTNQKTAPFYRRFLPWRERLVSVLVDKYRRCFKLALAHPRRVEGNAHKWAQEQLERALEASTKGILEWYVLACDGANEHVQPVGTIEFAANETSGMSLLAGPSPGLSTSWHAPAWLFEVSLESVGIGPQNPNHLPKTDSAEHLSDEHTHLLLEGAHRVFIRELEFAIERAQDEEMAAAGAIPEGRSTLGGQNRKSATPHSKGVEGLGRKYADYSRYMPSLTDKQWLAFSLRMEYSLGVTEIAYRMGLDRATVYEHLERANKNIDQSRSNEKRKASRAKHIVE
jgi:hypothetical protein